MVMAVKERILTGIMQSRRWRENADSGVCLNARQDRWNFICSCFDQPTYPAVALTKRGPPDT
jgi:hypothetical protein